MSASDQDLAGLPKYVREAWHKVRYATEYTRGTVIAPTSDMELIFDHHLRLARENAELRKVNEHANRANMQAQHFRDCAEAELAALKRSTQGTVQAVRPQADGCYLVEVRCDSAGVASLFSQRVALLPVGGE